MASLKIMEQPMWNTSLSWALSVNLPPGQMWKLIFSARRLVTNMVVTALTSLIMTYRDGSPTSLVGGMRHL